MKEYNQMKYEAILDDMFKAGYTVEEKNNIIFGSAMYNEQEFILCGVVNNAPLDNMMCQQLAEFILQHSQQNSTANFIILVDTAGQQATHFAELIGLNRYIAHLAKTIHYVRSMGSRFFGLVYGTALGGAFIATALNAEKIYALESAKIAVMWLEAMSRVTKVPLEKLEELSKHSPIFAPGAKNFVKLGALEAVLKPEQIMPQIIHDLQKQPDNIHQWRINGKERGGRSMANQVVNEILNA